MLTVSNNVNFKAIPVANVKVKGINSCYKLYKVNQSDKNFFEKLYYSMDLKKLMPNLQEHEYMCWSGILDNAIHHVNYSSKDSFLETCNNKPCGIINFSENKSNNYYLDYIVTFPAEIGKRVPCAGQILLNYLFKTVLKSNGEKIELSALKYTPFSPISVYSKLGFKFKGGDAYTEDMSINREGIRQAFEKQQEFLELTLLKNQENVDLGNVINLNI